MAVTPQQVRDQSLRGEFDGVDILIIQCVIDEEAGPLVGGSWGTKQDQGIIYMSAHILSRKLKGSSSPAGPVVGQSSGGLSRTYAGPAGGSIADLDLLTTIHGQAYARLARTVPTTPLVLHC